MGNDASTEYGPPVIMGEESIMAPKEHGTCRHAVQDSLVYGCDREKADKICCFNR